MPKAVLKNGVITPLEPLPAEWADGRELRVESAAKDDDDQEFDVWMQELQSLVAMNDPADFDRLEKALQVADELAKASVRKEMGLA